MVITAVTQKGPCKAENEDRIVAGHAVLSDGVLKSRLDTGILAIADGVGGNPGGAVASQFVAERISRLDSISMDSMVSINQELLSLSRSIEGYPDMATTLSGLYFKNGQMQIFSIGNTRVYRLINRQYLNQLTRDDTTVNRILSNGLLTEEDVLGFHQRNVIEACFGGGSEKYFHLSLSDKMRMPVALLITSDGIHDYLSVEEMEEILATSTSDSDACSLLITAARGNGSHDDASVLLAVM